MRKAGQSKEMTPEEQAAQTKKLQKWSSRLEAACAKLEAQSKIHEICAGILRKNMPHLITYQKTQQAHQSITVAIQELKIQAEAARRQYRGIRFFIKQWEPLHRPVIPPRLA